MMWKIAGTTIAAGILAIGLGSAPARADACSGNDHTTGTILGAVGGGLIGNAAGNGNAGAVIAGGVLGALAGNAVARDIDCNDRPYAARSYDESFRGRPGQRYSWNNQGRRGYVVTDREYRRGRTVCRDFTQVTYRGRREVARHGTACRDLRGGDWRFR